MSDAPTPPVDPPRPVLAVIADTTELEAVLARLRSDIDIAASVLAELVDQVDRLELPEPPELTTLREQVENLDAALSDANGRIEDVSGVGKVTSQRLDGLVERVNTNAQTAMAGIGDAETKLDDLSKRIIELVATVDNLASSVGRFGTTTGQRLDAIEARLSKLEGGAPLPPPARPDPFSRPFADSSPWNTPVAAGAQYLTVLTPSGGTVDLATSGGGTPWITVKAGPTVYDVAADVAPWTVTDPGRAKTYVIRLPANFTVSQSTDLHTVIVNGDDVWSLWNVTNINVTARTADVALAIKASLTGSGWGSGTTKAGTRACGCSNLGGNISGKPLAAGRIPHALALLHNGSVLAKGPVAPAISQDSWAINPSPNGYEGRTDGRGCHQGTRMAIPPSTSMPTGLKPEQITVWRALVEFGGYWTDATGGFTIYADSTVSAAQEANLNAGTFMQQAARALRIIA